MRFRAERGIDPERAAALAAQAPHNPFQTPAYARARADLGAEPWLLTLDGDGPPAEGCTAFLARGRLRTLLEIPSLPALSDPKPFWTGLREFCAEQRIGELRLQTFASDPLLIPALGREIARQERREFHLDLTVPDLRAGFGSNHRRNLKRAGRAGLAIAPCNEASALESHARAVVASMARRRERGEDVPRDADRRAFEAFVGHGAGDLFQARHEGHVVSSLLVLRAARGAYYHSAGSFPEGTELGASHFLICAVAERLRGESLERFNLGGAGEDEAGLARFKAGFGAQPVALEAARFDLAPAWRRAVASLLRRLR